MTKLLLTLLGLSASLTVGGGAALLFRRTRPGRQGKTICAIWAIVLLLAVVPLHLPAISLPVTLFGETGSRAVIHLDEDSALLTAWQTPSENTQTESPAPSRPADRTQTAPAVSPLPAALVLLWLAGTAVALGRTLRHTTALSASLRACSSPPLPDDQRRRLLEACCAAAGIRRLPALRVFDPSIPYPPCTAGLFRPTVYLPAHLPDTVDPGAILAHELCHVRRRDMLRKLIARALLAPHWFNPIAYFIFPRISEDLELACDTDTLALLRRVTGEDRRITYMQTLLDTALATRISAPGATLALTEDSSRAPLKRRFQHMTQRRPRLTTLISLLLIGVILLTSAAAFTACTTLSAADDPAVTDLHPLVDRILRYAYNLSPTDPITRDMLEGITSLQLSRHMANDWLSNKEEPQTRTLVDFRVNAPADNPDSVITRNRNEAHGFVWLEKNFLEQNVLRPVTNSRDQQKLFSFYMYDIEDTGGYHMPDNVSRVEQVEVFSLMYTYGILEPQFIDSTAIDTAIFDVLPNLITLDLVGLTAAN